MTDLSPHKVSETKSAITLGWTPPSDQWGYVPVIDDNEKLTDGKRHIGVGATTSQVTIGKPSDETNPVSKHRYGIKILGVAAVGEYPAVTPPPPTSSVIAYRYTVDPYPEQPSGPGNASWIVFGEPTLEGPFNNDNAIIRWEPGGQPGTPFYAGGRTVHLLGFRLIEGSPGRILDWHTSSMDKPYGWTPMYTKDVPGVGVAPLAIDYWQDSYGLMVVPECQGYYDGKYKYTILSQSEMEARRGQWIWLWVDVTWGRTDGSTPRTGALKVGLPTDASPRVNLSNIATHYYGEHFVTFWAGCYDNHGFKSRVVIDHAGYRVGRTPAEALAQQPYFIAHWEGGTVQQIADWDGNQTVPAWLS